MEPIKRRGFVAGLLGFFGLMPLAKAGEPATDVEVKRIAAGDFARAVESGSGPQVIRCRPGDILDLDVDGHHYLAELVEYELSAHRDWHRLNWDKIPADYQIGPEKVRIKLVLESDLGSKVG